MRVLVLNGPNLNLLGTRRPEVYGSTTLAELEARCRDWGAELGMEIETYQSNHEGDLIDRLHAARSACDGVVLNAGAYTHTSYALHDAIEAVELPVVEVHISNVHAREAWRRRSVLRPACAATIFGRGIDGYRWALRHLHARAAWPFTTIPYGPGADQVGDLRLPTGGGPHPVVVLLHGGFWREEWTRDLMEALAVAFARDGWATWNLEYRRVGAGGGWPSTLADVAAGIDHLALLGRPLDLDRVVVLGHSAGGQLALWSAARGGLPDDAPGARPTLLPERVVALAGVVDLVAAHRLGVGHGAVAGFLGRTPTAGARRYALADPAALLPWATPTVLLHGTADDRVPLELSRGFARRAHDAGVPVRLVELPGLDHFAPIEPRSEAWPKVVEAVGGLSRP